MELEVVKEWLEYDPISGELHWLKSPANRIKVGDRAGYYGGRYIQIQLMNKRRLAHVICYALYHGHWPKGQVDHVDQDTHNNRAYNLKDVTGAINAKNKPKRRDNKSGVTGVSWDKVNKKWVVWINNKEGKSENRGRYVDLGEAKRVRDKAAYELGYHKNHGKVLSRQEYRRV